MGPRYIWAPGVFSLGLNSSGRRGNPMHGFVFKDAKISLENDDAHRTYATHAGDCMTQCGYIGLKKGQ